jgi:nitrous oxidase accessory protein NosD
VFDYRVVFKAEAVQPTSITANVPCLETYVDKTLGYSISVPAEWEHYDIGSPGSHLWLLPEEASKPNATFIEVKVYWSPWSEPFTEKVIRNYFQFGNLKSLEVQIESESRARALLSLQDWPKEMCLLVSRLEYYIEVRARGSSEKRFEEYCETFDYCLNSFRIQKVNIPVLPPTPIPAPVPVLGLIQVDDDSKDCPNAGFTKIQDAVDAASAGDTIIVHPGIYTENLNVGKERLAIKSQGGAGSTIVQALNSDDHVFEIKADHVNISGFTIRGAMGNDKAGIYSYDSPLSVSDLILSNNNYGIYAYSTPRSPLHVSCSVFSSNNHGIYSHSTLGSRYGEVNVSDSTFSDNIHGIYTSDFCGVRVTNSTFSSNDYGISGHNRMGIHAEHSIFSNNIYGIYGDSIWGINSLHSNFYDNDYGVYAVNGWDNTLSISYSNFRDSNLAIYYRASTISSHIVFLNNFINNISDVDSSPSEYIWNSLEQITYKYNGKTYISYLGNYWSRHIGPDTNGDGIVDTPYSVNGNKDNYPLIGTWKDGAIK